jgi:hypothetical protein
MTGLAAKVAVPAVVQAVPWKLIFDFSIALAFLVVLAWGLRVNDLRGRWLHQYQSEHAARANDLKVYRQAQANAAAKNKADVAAAAQKQKDISNAQVATLNDRLARLSDELRARGPAAQSHPVEPGVPQTGNASPGTPGAPGLCLSPDQLLRAAQDEERHNELIDWVLKQSSIDPNTGASAK